MGSQGAGGPPARLPESGKLEKASMFSLISCIPWEVLAGVNGGRRGYGRGKGGKPEESEGSVHSPSS